MTLARLATFAIVALVFVASAFGTLTVLGRIIRQRLATRRARLAAPARRMLLQLAAGDGDEAALVERLAAIDGAVWRAVEPSAVAMLGKVRGEAHATLVTVFMRRGAAMRAERDLHARSPVRRARAAEVLGNLGERVALGALCELLADPNPDTRVVAARALGRIADPAAALPLLRSVAGRRPVPPQLAAHAVLRLGLAAQAEVEHALDHPDEIVRATAVEVLGLIGAVGSTPRVEAALRSDLSGEVQRRAARTLGRLGARSALAPLLEAVGPDRPAALRAVAAEALGDLGAAAAAEPLAALLADTQYRVAHHAARSLLRLGLPGLAALRAATGAAEPHAREALAMAELADGRRDLVPVP
jgi:HEAT repeat protein